MPARFGAALLKTGELAAIGGLVGAGTAGVQRVSTFIRRKVDPNYKPAIADPGVTRCAVGSAVFTGVLVNLRY